ncbi:MAG: molybdopterin synthase sulfur carrier subunit [Myxococcota bacterium]|nr:molybdopterin synthase sulfur carrier subunit [Myxococcota bacterium]
MPVVLVPTAYRGPTRGLSEIEVEATDVRSALLAVESLHPGFGELVLDEEGQLRRFVKLFINGEQIESSALDKPLGVVDRLEVLAAIAGG